MIDQADRYFAVELSRDGTQAALEVLDDNGIGDIWTLDLERGVRQRLPALETLGSIHPNGPRMDSTSRTA